jgi:branched-subunit amino acid transport protein AzlD
MKTGLAEAVFLSVAMGLVILFCRAFPFLFFRGKPSRQFPPPESPPSAPSTLPEPEKGEGRRKEAARAGAVERFLAFVEKAAPPAAMTVLAFNAIAGQVRADLRAGAGPGLSALAASALTALLHLWKRNPLLSIFGGTAAYIILERLG